MLRAMSTPDKPAEFPARPRILYLVAEDWSFWSHRLPLARAAHASGFEVVVATRVRAHGDLICNEGFRLVPISLERGGRNPVRDFFALAGLVRLYAREKPDIVHHVGLKPVLYGSIAAWISRRPAVVNALTGLGYVFLSRQWLARALRLCLGPLLRILLNRPGGRLILQNSDDARLLIEERLAAPERIAVIRGSGVDTSAFKPGAEAVGVPVAVLASRMLWDKGVGELVEAARILKTRGAPVRVLLLGNPDPENPASIPVNRLKAWHEEGVVTWSAYVSGMPEVLRRCHIAVLPSYREGLPKSLLEAAAAGLPIVASDVPGCREIAKPGENAILVPVKDAAALADAIERLARDAELRRRLGRRGREIAESQFAEEIVVAQTLALYRAMLGPSWASAAKA
jgi:glycosyltransferase involved in cell wall biosynthesis